MKGEFVLVVPVAPSFFIQSATPNINELEHMVVSFYWGHIPDSINGLVVVVIRERCWSWFTVERGGSGDCVPPQRNKLQITSENDNVSNVPTSAFYMIQMYVKYVLHPLSNNAVLKNYSRVTFFSCTAKSVSANNT